MFIICKYTEYHNHKPETKQGIITVTLGQTNHLDELITALQNENSGSNLVRNNYVKIQDGIRVYEYKGIVNYDIKAALDKHIKSAVPSALDAISRM